MKKNQFLVKHYTMIALLIIAIGCKAQSMDDIMPGDDFKIPLLAINAMGLEEINAGYVYMLDDEVSFNLQSFLYVSPEAYDEQGIIDRIKSLNNGEVEIISISCTDDRKTDLGCPVWKIVYNLTTEYNQYYCTDIYFRTHFAEYCAQASVTIDKAEPYKEEMDSRMASIWLLPLLTIDTTDLEPMPDGVTPTYMGERVSIELKSFILPDDAKGQPVTFDKERKLERIKELNYDNTSAEKIVHSKKYSKQLGVTAYLISYIAGSNEDARYHLDLCFQEGKVGFHVSMSADPDAVESKKAFENEAKQRMNTMIFETDFSKIERIK